MARRETYKQKLEKHYKKQMKRITQLEKRGYKVPESAYPSMPKRVDKRTYESFLKRNTLDYLYDKSTFYDMESDRYVSGKRGRELERSRAGKKGARTRKEREQEKKHERTTFEDGVLREVENMVEQAQSTYKNPYGKDMLRNLLFEQIAEKGRRYVAEKFQMASGWVISSAERVLYSSDQFEIQTNFNAILVLLTDRALEARELQKYYDTYADEGWN